MTHDDLVERAVKWLKNPSKHKSGCGVAVPELVSYASESPDAIGWYGGNGSHLIECKVSRSDFLADKKKIHRHGPCAGQYRWYLCPPSLIKPEETPETWGLLYCHADRITVEKIADQNPNRSLHQEIRMMYSLLRRVSVRGQLRRCLAPKWGGDRKFDVAPPDLEQQEKS